MQATKSLTLQFLALQAVLVGSDIPDICESILDAAFAALDNCEVR